MTTLVNSPSSQDIEDASSSNSLPMAYLSASVIGAVLAPDALAPTSYEQDAETSATTSATTSASSVAYSSQYSAPTPDSSSPSSSQNTPKPSASSTSSPTALPPTPQSSQASSSSTPRPKSTRRASLTAQVLNSIQSRRRLRGVRRHRPSPLPPPPPSPPPPPPRFPPDVGLGGIVTRVGGSRTRSNPDVDEDVDVTTDDVELFGPPQLSERHLVEHVSGSSAAIRDVLLDESGEGSTVMDPVPLRRSRGMMNLLEDSDEGDNDDVNVDDDSDDSLPPPSPSPPQIENNFTIPAGRKRKRSGKQVTFRKKKKKYSSADVSSSEASTSSAIGGSFADAASTSAWALSSALRSSQFTQTETDDSSRWNEIGYEGSRRAIIDHFTSRIQKLEAVVHNNDTSQSQPTDMPQSSCRCMICMDPYKDPCVSIKCWHVHCQDCWLRSLAVRKACPVCTTIVNPGDLRRIYV